MATVTGYTKERMLVIENETVVGGSISGNDLILATREGNQINAGNVRGPQGIQGPAGTGIQTCTSSTRPTGIAIGTYIHETDTGKLWVWNGANWVPGTMFADVAANAPTTRPIGYPYYVNDANLPIGSVVPDTSRPVTPGIYHYAGTVAKWNQPWNQPWGFMAYKNVTTTQSGITTLADVTGLTATWTAVANRRIETRVEIPVLSTVDNDFAQIQITDGAGSVKDSGQARVYTINQKLIATCWEITVAGSWTRKAMLQRSSGTGSLSAACGSALQGRLVMIDHGPAGAPS